MAAAGESATPADGDMVIIDIRHPDECSAGCLPVAADAAEVLAIPYYALARRFEELPRHKNYYLVCSRGVMSQVQAAELRKLGYDNVQALTPSMAKKRD